MNQKWTLSSDTSSYSTPQETKHGLRATWRHDLYHAENFKLDHYR